MIQEFAFNTIFKVTMIRMNMNADATLFQIHL